MTIEQSILLDADLCVLCGMCLPHCPTYTQSGNEAESPRGRISLMLALARGQLEATPQLACHIESCLGCRACEAMCPSEVPYGRLLGNTRRLLAERRKPPMSSRLLLALISRPWVQRLAIRTGKLVPRRLLGHTRLAAFLPTRSRPPVFHTPGERRQNRGRVALFVGCTGESFDKSALDAASTLLREAGFKVTIPKHQTCCGTMHHSQGDRAGFEQRARVNLAAFAEADTIVFIASGCGAMLRDYETWLPEPAARAFATRAEEISVFLAREGFPEGTLFEPLEGSVAVHVPCTQRNVLRAPHGAEALLRHIPRLAIHMLPDNNRCCGSAGTHVLTHQATADALRAPKVEALARSSARYLATTNVGCALHIAEGAREAGLTVEVLHPVTLLARQLRLSGPCPS